MVAASHFVVAACRETGHLPIHLEIHDKLENSIFWDIKQFAESQSIFWKNISSPYLGLKNKPSMKQ
jgi:hypothetical protein